MTIAYWQEPGYPTDAEMPAIYEALAAMGPKLADDYESPPVDFKAMARGYLGARPLLDGTHGAYYDETAMRELLRDRGVEGDDA